MSEASIEIQLYFTDPLKCQSAKTRIESERCSHDSVFSRIESFNVGKNDVLVTSIASSTINEISSALIGLEADAVAVKIDYDSGEQTSFGYIGGNKSTRRKAIEWVANQDPERRIWNAFNRNDMDAFVKLAEGVLTREELTSALQMSILNELDSQAKILLEMGADPNLSLELKLPKKSYMITPVQLAFEQSGFNSSKVVLELLNMVSEVNFRDTEGNTALHLALNRQVSRHEEIAKKVLELGVDPTLINYKEETALTTYVKNFRFNTKLLKVTQLLLDAGYSQEQLFGKGNFFHLLDECIRKVAESLCCDGNNLGEQQKLTKSIDRLIKVKALLFKQA